MKRQETAQWPQSRGARHWRRPLEPCPRPERDAQEALRAGEGEEARRGKEGSGRYAAAGAQPRRPGPRGAPSGGPVTADGGADEEAWRRVRGVGAVGLLLTPKPHTAPMPLFMTTDPRGWSTRRGARLGRGASERERERAATAGARESGGGEGRPKDTDEKSPLEAAGPSAVRMARCTASSWCARAESCAMSSLTAVPREADMDGERTEATREKSLRRRE